MRWLAVILAMLGTQGHALSCLRPDPAASFAMFQEAPDPYYIMHGTLTFDDSKLPAGVVNAARDPDPIPAQFVGRGLTGDGFTVDLDRVITLQSVCFGPWCGQLQSGSAYLMFARAADNGITLEVDPCGTTVFANPADAVLDQMKVCLNGGACEPAR